MELLFKSGGRLDRLDWVYDEEAQKGDYVPTDVSQDALSFLMEPVRFDSAISLRDIFALLERNPAVMPLFHRDWAAEYLAEYRKVRDTALPYTGEYDPDGIETLELYQTWEKNSATREISGYQRLGFHGIGFGLREDIMQDDWVLHAKGSRIAYAVEFTPLSRLLNLPLRLNLEVPVYEADTTGHLYATRLETLQMSPPTLAQVFHGILWELSFAGGPEEAAAEAEEVRTTVIAARDAAAAGDEARFGDLDLAR